VINRNKKYEKGNQVGYLCTSISGRDGKGRETLSLMEPEEKKGIRNTETGQLRYARNLGSVLEKGRASYPRLFTRQKTVTYTEQKNCFW